MGTSAPEKIINTRPLTQVVTRFNSVEVAAWSRFQKKMGFDGHGSSSKCAHETLRAAMKAAGCLGQLPE